MSGSLLDANVISELTKPAPDRRVIAFLTDHDDLWLSSVVLHELEFGIQMLPPGHRRERIISTLSAFVVKYDDRILAVARPEAEWAARFRAQIRRLGRALPLADALIAGTAKAHGLSVATRNVADFQGLDVDVTNPWQNP